jgi:hypothetical protein
MGSTGVDRGGRGLKRDGALVYGADREVIQWVASIIPGFHINPQSTAIGVIKRGELVAGLVYERWNGVNVEMSIGAKPKSGWADKAVLRGIFSYPFLQLECRTITIVVAASNRASLSLVTRLGFEGEAVVRFAADDGGDLIVLKMYREKCRWI